MRMRWIRLHDACFLLGLHHHNHDDRTRIYLGITYSRGDFAAGLPPRLELSDHPLDLGRLSS